MTCADLTKPNAAAPPLAVSEAEAARLIGVSARTMVNWRASGTGPRAVRAGGRVLYAVTELQRWLEAAADRAPAGVEQPAVQAISPPLPVMQAKSTVDGGGR